MPKQGENQMAIPAEGQESPLSKEDARKALISDMMLQEEAAPFQTQAPGSFYSRY
jgi:hypothetical protein